MAEYTVFVGSQDAGTAQFMQNLGRLPPQHRSLVDVVSVQPGGPEPPEYVRGVPTLVSHEPVPRVWEGAHAIEMMAKLDPDAAAPDAPASPDLPGPSASAAPRPGGRGKGGRAATAFIDSLDTDPNGARPPMDDRQGFSASESGGKITQSDIDAYTKLRNTAMPMPSVAM